MSFISSLNELKPYLKFNLNSNIKKMKDFSLNEFDIIIIHDEDIKNIEIKKYVSSTNSIKILATNKNVSNHFDHILKLPTTINEINSIVENAAIKKKFSLNSSIKIKNYLLDKNERKLIKDNEYINLTEKEVQLLELFLINNKTISKNEILALVWNYSPDADTHTVETHIYRLRKKISDKFSDENFILNNKEGYII